MPAKKNDKTNAKATKKQPNAKAKPATPKKLSALSAAARVLSENGGSMTTKEMIETMAQKKLWESPNGKTPAATLYAAILLEITTKGTDSRFKKTEPGKFAATGKAQAQKETPAPKPKTAKPKGAKTVKKTGKQPAEAKPAEPVQAPTPDATGTVPAA
jgi:hypothetical protein